MTPDSAVMMTLGVMSSSVCISTDSENSHWHGAAFCAKPDQNKGNLRQGNAVTPSQETRQRSLPYLRYEEKVALHVKPPKVEDLHKVKARQHGLVAAIVVQAHPCLHGKDRRVERIAGRDADVRLAVKAAGVEEKSAVGGIDVRVDSALRKKDDVTRGAARAWTRGRS